MTYGSGGAAAQPAFSVQFAPEVPRERVDVVVDALRLFRLGYSWGGPMSLAVPYDLAPMRPKAAPPRGMLVRFSIGLEDPKDLIFAQALMAS